MRFTSHFAKFNTQIIGFSHSLPSPCLRVLDDKEQGRQENSPFA